MVFKREVIDIDNKLIVTVFYVCDNRGKHRKLVFINFYHSKAAVVKLVKYCLYARRFARSAVAVKQGVVGGQTAYERLGIIDELLFLELVTDEVAKADAVGVVDGRKLERVAVLDAEGAVKTEHSDADALIKIGNERKNLVFVGSRFNF